MWVRTHLSTERYYLNLQNVLLIKRLNSSLAITKKRFVSFLPATIFQIWRIYLLSRKLLDTVYFQQVLSCLFCALVSHCRRNESLLCSDPQCCNYVKLSQEWDRCFLDSDNPGVYGQRRRWMECRKGKWGKGANSGLKSCRCMQCSLLDVFCARLLGSLWSKMPNLPGDLLETSLLVQ